MNVFGQFNIKLLIVFLISRKFQDTKIKIQIN